MAASIKVHAHTRVEEVASCVRESARACVCVMGGGTAGYARDFGKGQETHERDRASPLIELKIKQSILNE